MESYRRPNHRRYHTRAPWLFLASWCLTGSTGQAAYNVVLKDGNIIEAQAKPVSMDGQWIIRALDGRTIAVSIMQVNVPATEVTNQAGSQFAGIAQQPVTGNQQHALSTGQTAQYLSNKDVMEMHRIGLGPDLIVAKMKSSPCKFDTSLKHLSRSKHRVSQKR